MLRNARDTILLAVCVMLLRALLLDVRDGAPAFPGFRDRRQRKKAQLGQRRKYQGDAKGQGPRFHRDW